MIILHSVDKQTMETLIEEFAALYPVENSWSHPFWTVNEHGEKILLPAGEPVFQAFLREKNRA